MEVNWQYTMANTDGWLVSIKMDLRFSMESTQRHIDWNLMAANCCQPADGAENRGWTLCYICGATFFSSPTPHPSFRGFRFIWRNRFNKRHLFYKNTIVIKLLLIQILLLMQWIFYYNLKNIYFIKLESGYNIDIQVECVHHVHNSNIIYFRWKFLQL